MAGNEIPASGDLVFKPCARAFFVYYVAMALVFLGPGSIRRWGCPSGWGPSWGSLSWPQ